MKQINSGKKKKKSDIILKTARWIFCTDLSIICNWHQCHLAENKSMAWSQKTQCIDLRFRPRNRSV